VDWKENPPERRDCFLLLVALWSTFAAEEGVLEEGMGKENGRAPPVLVAVEEEDEAGAAEDGNWNMSLVVLADGWISSR